jgi:hypothetical protein
VAAGASGDKAVAAMQDRDGRCHGVMGAIWKDRQHLHLRRSTPITGLTFCELHIHDLSVSCSEVQARGLPLRGLLEKNRRP